MTNETAIDTALDKVSQVPRLWNVLRWIVEAGFVGEREVIARELDPWRDVGARRFIDFGCGTGEFAHDFPAPYYVGIDLSTIYLRFAAQMRGGRYVASSGDALALAAESFDAALVLGVLHHLPDPIAAAGMVELHRVLRPGATALVIEDVPPPTIWNLPGHLMHALDRGGYIRDDAAYKALFGPGFAVEKRYHMRSGICDYGVYVLKRV
jgi:SAM-dependent methyltransferase